MRFPDAIELLRRRIAAADGRPRALAAPADAAAAGEERGDDDPAPEQLEAEPAVALEPSGRPADRTLERATEAAESLNLGLHLGSAVIRIAAAAERGTAGAEQVRDAIWLLERYVELLEVRPLGADINAEQRRLAHVDATLARVRALSASLAEETSRETEGSASAEPAAPEAEAPVPPAPSMPGELPSLRREIALMAARWAVMVVSVVVVVLAVTLIADWR